MKRVESLWIVVDGRLCRRGDELDLMIERDVFY